MPDSDTHAKNRSLTVGLTGGIASGKSTVAARLAELGIPVIDTDVISRTIVDPNSDLGQITLTQLQQALGPDILQADGQLDRAAVRQKVFGSEARHREARAKLEAVMHPTIHDEVRRQIAELDGTAPYLLIVIPLLAEPATRERYRWLDRVVAVLAPETTRRSRLCQRPGITPEIADALIAAQAGDDARAAIADHIITNNGSLDTLEQQVQSLDQALRQYHQHENHA